MFGDITTARIWYANRAEVLAADDDSPTTVAPIYEIDAGLRRLTEEKYPSAEARAKRFLGWVRWLVEAAWISDWRSTTTASSTS